MGQNVMNNKIVERSSPVGKNFLNVQKTAKETQTQNRIGFHAVLYLVFPKIMLSDPQNEKRLYFLFRFQHLIK